MSNSIFSSKAVQTLLFGLLFTFLPFLQKSLHAQLLTKGTGTLRVLAVMVEFEEDDNEFTTGNGLFGPGSLPFMENEDIKIDPLPHNFNYFDAHLSFAKNWYSRASAQQLTIDYTLLPTVYKLNNPIEAYSPTGEEFDFELLASLVKDVWTAVDQGPELNLNWTPDDQTALVIFHAGVGRDIELIGTILDKTFQDIPSIYMSRNALNDFNDIINPDLFTIKNGTVPVTNSLIIPRTLSRRGVLFEEEQVVSFSINGLLVASIASHIGLPDLFNTENGQSAIGQFGLMDGAGFILSYNGLFPPYPSAWERMKLGWDAPFLINGRDGQQIDLPAVALGNSNNSVAKYEISKDEYFLFENRFRNANGTGVNLTYRLPDGSTTTQQFTNQDSVFSGQYADFDTLLIKGVLTDVDNADFALPGGLDYGNDGQPSTADDRELNGGILIWHINESVINANPTRINADDQNRGVDLEEADGAQDIGFPLEGSLVDLSSGHAYDFWWQNNDYRVITEIDTIRNYQNRFGLDTRPNSNNIAGGASFFEAFDFTDSQANASFRFRKTESTNLTKVANRNIAGTPNTNESGINIQNIASFRYFESSNQRLVTTFSTSIASIYDATTPEVFTNINVSGQLYSSQITKPVNNADKPLLVLFWIGDDASLHIDAYEIGPDLSLSAAWQKNHPQSVVNVLPKYALTQSGSFLKNLFGTFKLNLTSGELTVTEDIEPLILRSSNGSSLTINNSLLSSYNLQDDEVVGALPLEGELTRYAIFTTNTTWILDENGVPLKALIREMNPDDVGITNQAFIPANALPAFADLNGDGSIDIVQANANGTKIHAYNASGTELDGFPIALAPYKLQVNGPLLLFQNTLTSDTYLLFEAKNEFKNYMLSISTQNGKMQPNFPLSLASANSINAVSNMSAPILIGENPTELHFLRYDGELLQWQLKEQVKSLWGSAFGATDEANFSTSEMVDNDTNLNLNDILNIDETYNWPNPVRNGRTSIRYQSQAGASISIIVAQPSGKIVHKTDFESGSSLPESYELDTNNFASGVYLVSVNASMNGQTQKKIIKMVVVQ